jgi:hypothetical protein
MATTVCDVRRLSAEQLADPAFVYVGRRVVRGRHNFPASPFGNPSYGDNADWAERYRRHVLRTPALAALLPSLRGKRLGCWCCDQARPAAPGAYACHAQVLAELADGPLGGPGGVTPSGPPTQGELF